jgi:6-phosphogluconolactonase
MFSSSRNDLFSSDATFKKNPTTKISGRPREKRMIGQTERARMMKASSSRKRDRQACSFCKMNGCRVSNCILMKGLGGKPLEPHYVSFLISCWRAPPTTSMSTHSKNITVAALGVAAVAVAFHYLLLKPLREKSSSKKGEEKSPGPVTKKYSDRTEVSKELCAFVAESAKAAIAARGVFHLSVAGGSLLDALVGLADHKDTVDFSKVVLSFANHKCVEPDSENATVAKSKKKFGTAAGITTFIAPSPKPVDGGDGSAEAALYAKALKDAGVPHANGYPVVDLVLLGLGADGHVGSCHPMSPAVAETSKSVAASLKSGEPASITLTIETMNTARQVAIVVCGGSKGKKEAVKRAMARPAENPRGTFPAQLLKEPLFFLDSEAAADL